MAYGKKTFARLHIHGSTPATHSTPPFSRRGQIDWNRPLPLLSLVLLLFLWQFSQMLIADTPRRFLIPAPLEVATRFIKMLADGTLLHHTGITLLEMSLGLACGTATALLLGYIIAHNRFLARLLEPIIVISQAMPIVALAPLLTVWLGPRLASKVFICALIVFFPILVNVTVGLKSIDPRLRDLFSLLEASRWQQLLHLEIPSVLPDFLAGLRVGGTLAGMGAVVGEFVASSAGLGYLVKQGQNTYDLPEMFVAILTLMVIALSVYGTLTVIERQIMRHRLPDETIVHQ
jgi:NitT/TauT family transport system permease protein